MRPHYETPEYLAKESAFAAWLCKHWSQTCMKLPDKYKADYLFLEDGKGKAWVELRIRARKYPGGYMLSLAKWQAMMQLADTSFLPAKLAVKWDDTNEIGVVTLGYLKGKPDIRPGGNGEDYRGDSQDMEPCVYLPYEDFEMLRPARIEVRTVEGEVIEQVAA